MIKIFLKCDEPKTDTLTQNTRQRWESFGLFILGFRDKGVMKSRDHHTFGFLYWFNGVKLGWLCFGCFILIPSCLCYYHPRWYRGGIILSPASSNGDVYIDSETLQRRKISRNEMEIQKGLMWYLQDKVCNTVQSGLFSKSNLLSVQFHTTKSKNGGLYQQTKWNITGSDTVFSPPSLLYELCPPALKYPISLWKQQIKLRRVHLHMNHFSQHRRHTSTTQHCSSGNAEKDATEAEKALAIKRGRRVT